MTTQTIVVSYPAGEITVVGSGPVGPRGYPGSGGPGGSGGYDHTQSSALTTWTINHNLGYRPSVQTFTVGGLEVIGEILHVSVNQVTVTFNSPISGSARLV